MDLTVRHCFYMLFIVLTGVPTLGGCDRPPFKGSDDKESSSNQTPKPKHSSPIIDAFSRDDVKEVEILPADPKMEPWGISTFNLVGVFPDGKTKGRVPEGVVWSIANPELALIGQTSGFVLAQKEGETEITAEYLKFKTTTKLRIMKDPNASYDLGEPLSFKAETLSSTEIKLTWIASPARVTGHKLVINDLSAGASQPPATCESAPSVRIMELKMVETIVVNGLTAATSYGFRLCSEEEIDLGDLKASRQSAGVVLTASTNP